MAACATSKELAGMRPVSNAQRLLKHLACPLYIFYVDSRDLVEGGGSPDGPLAMSIVVPPF